MLDVGFSCKMKKGGIVKERKNGRMEHSSFKCTLPFYLPSGGLGGEHAL
jgi:hypothetical protein